MAARGWGCPVSISFPYQANGTHLQLHYRLLKARSNHSLLLRLLAGSPGSGPVGRLEVPGALGRLGFLPQGRIPIAHGIHRSSIGRRDIGLGRTRGRIVARDEVLGEARHGGRVAGPGGKSGGPGGEGRDPATNAGQHVGNWSDGRCEVAEERRAKGRKDSELDEVSSLRELRRLSGQSAALLRLMRWDSAAANFCCCSHQL